LIDGNHLPKDLPCPARAIIGGDALVPAISAASILAKVTRDRLMMAMDTNIPVTALLHTKAIQRPSIWLH
jgi:ribonuclease HII